MSWGPPEVRDFITGFDQCLVEAADVMMKRGIDGAKLISLNTSSLQVRAGGHCHLLHNVGLRLVHHFG